MDKIADDIEFRMLDPKANQVSSAIAWYAARKVIVDQSKCLKYQEMAVSTSEIEELETKISTFGIFLEEDYLFQQPTFATILQNILPF